MLARPFHVVALAALAAPVLAAQAQVHVVSPTGPLTDLQATIDAAAEGDVILVKSGSYPSLVVDGKSLTVVADLGQNVDVLAPFGATGDVVAVRNLGASQTVVLRGIDVLQTPGIADVVRIEDNDGTVWIEHAQFTPAPLSLTGGVSHPATVAIEDSAGVILSGVVAAGQPGVAGFVQPTLAGPAVSALDSQLAVHDSTLDGGDGHAGYINPIDFVFPGGDGADALRLDGGSLYLSNSFLRGGDGGDGLPAPFQCSNGGNGGPGLRLVGANPLATDVGSFLAGGAPGQQTILPCIPGNAGAATLVVAGSFVNPSSRPASMIASATVREGQSLTLIHVGSPGDVVVDLIGFTPNFAPPVGTPLHGVIAMQPLRADFVGVLPGGGQLTTLVPIGELGAGVAGLPAYVQPVAIEPATATALTGRPTALLLLDGAI